MPSAIEAIRDAIVSDAPADVFADLAVPESVRGALVVAFEAGHRPDEGHTGQNVRRAFEPSGQTRCST